MIQSDSGSCSSLGADPNGDAAIGWLRQTETDENLLVMYFQVATAIGESRLLEHANHFEQLGNFVQAAWLFFDAGKLVRSQSFLAKSEEYLVTARSVLAKLTMRTQESFSLELDVEVKILNGWSTQMYESLTALATLIEDEAELFQNLGPTRRKFTKTLVHLCQAMFPLMSAEWDNPLLPPFCREILEQAVKLEQAGSDLDQEPLALQAVHMCVSNS